MSKSLKELRAHWEKGQDVLAVLSAHDRFGVAVLLQSGDKLAVHRYFQMGGKWDASVDYWGKSFKDAAFAFAMAASLVGDMNACG
jgi:hypothetical protein